MTPNEIAYIQNSIRVTDICLAARAMREAEASLTHRESFDRARVVVDALKGGRS